MADTDIKSLKVSREAIHKAAKELTDYISKEQVVGAVSMDPRDDLSLAKDAISVAEKNWTRIFDEEIKKKGDPHPEKGPDSLPSDFAAKVEKAKGTLAVNAALDVQTIVDSHVEKLAASQTKADMEKAKKEASEAHIDLKNVVSETRMAISEIGEAAGPTPLGVPAAASAPSRNLKL